MKEGFGHYFAVFLSAQTMTLSTMAAERHVWGFLKVSFP
jgi:hypothetical protein